MSVPNINPKAVSFSKFLLAKPPFESQIDMRGLQVLGRLLVLFAFLSVFSVAVTAQSAQGDTAVMQVLKKSLTLPSSVDWSNSNPCQWDGVGCDPSSGRVARIQIGNRNVGGSLPSDIRNLTELLIFEVMGNNLDGHVPSLAGLDKLEVLFLHKNQFVSIPPDFFSGMSNLQSVDISDNPFSPWELPDSLRVATGLQNFSANSANITGKIPEFFNASTFPSMVALHLAMNNLIGGLPSTFIGFHIQSLWLNSLHNVNKLNGTIDVIASMTDLVEVWLHGNQFTGPIPDLSKLKNLQTLSLRDNQLTGVTPEYLVKLPTLSIVNLTNNYFQGPMPSFPQTVKVDMTGRNSFCQPNPGIPCDPRVNILLSIAQPMNYPLKFAEQWDGNDPCNGWLGITCSNGNITVINFPKMGLSGTISPDYSQITTLQRLILSDNNLIGPIPNELGSLPNLEQLDVSNNNLSGKIPSFRSNVILITNGNPTIGKDIPVPSPKAPGAPGTPTSSGPGVEGSKKKSVGVIIGSLVGGVFGVALVGLLIFCLAKKRPTRSGKVQSPNNVMVVHPRRSGENGVKITVTAANATGSTSETHSYGSGGTGDIQVVEAGSMVISIQVLRDVTNNFSEDNVLGKGGFGTVYRGELHDGTKIAVKRMESGVVAEKGLAEFKAEIAVLTKVRHRHLVSLLGYCLDGNERLLVYEYMPQGTFSRHLFNWKVEGLKPLEWTRRLSIALDVARGVEYLHSLAHQTFIHRDLKPSNILLGDDMRAKVADFGLVRLAPEGKGSIETRLAGTFGYLAPEYAVTGRVTTKVDVFSFGVILMEMITGRKALDETQPEDSVHLATWFRRMHLSKDTFRKAIDPTIDCDEETLASISTVAELACHCCAREPYQRPDMGHAVNVLSSLIELWKPSETDAEDIYGIDLDMTLPQALKKWQQLEGSNVDESSSSYVPSEENTQSSIPNRPPGFASSFASTDGR